MAAAVGVAVVAAAARTDVWAVGGHAHTEQLALAPSRTAPPRTLRGVGKDVIVPATKTLTIRRMTGQMMNINSKPRMRGRSKHHKALRPTTEERS